MQKLSIHRNKASYMLLFKSVSFTLNELYFVMDDSCNQIPETAEQVRLRLVQPTYLCYVV